MSFLSITRLARARGVGQARCRNLLSHLQLVWLTGVFREKNKNTVLKFLRVGWKSFFVACAWDDPQLFGTRGGPENRVCVALGNRGVFSPTNEQDRERPGGNRFFRGDFFKLEATLSLGLVRRDYRDGTEKRLAQKGAPMKAGVVVGDFLQIPKGALGDDGFNARLDCSGLQSRGRTHRFA